MTPAQARSVAALLVENSAAYRRLAPAGAEAMAAVAVKLLEWGQPRRRHMKPQRDEVKTRLAEWMIRYRDRMQGQPRPRLEDIIAAATTDLRHLGHIPRKFVEKARPPEWQFETRGRPRKNSR